MILEVKGVLTICMTYIYLAISASGDLGGEGCPYHLRDIHLLGHFHVILEVKGVLTYIYLIIYARGDLRGERCPNAISI